MGTKNILFLCVANSARSQIAEGLAKKILGSEYNIESAGTMPAEQVHSEAVDVLKEIGVDISTHKPKSLENLNQEFMNKLDFVITLCEEEQCPQLKSRAKKLHWPHQDPALTPQEHIKMKNFRKVRDEIKDQLYDFKRSLI